MGYDIPADHHGSEPRNYRRVTPADLEGEGFAGMAVTDVWVDEPKPDMRFCDQPVLGDAQMIHDLKTGLKDLRPLVIIESPFASDIPRNIAYGRACCRDSVLRGEAPFASHLLYTQPGILRDEVLEERELGMGLGWHIMRRANLVAIYIDLGWSSGMQRGKEAAIVAGKTVVERQLGPTDQWKDNWESAHHFAEPSTLASAHSFPHFKY